MCTDKKIETADELEFAVFCIENVAARLHVHAEAIYKAFTGQSDILTAILFLNMKYFIRRVKIIL